MAYKYFPEYMSSLRKNPKSLYEDEMQKFVDDQFYNASDWYQIQEEAVFGSSVYTNLDVRINSVVSVNTGQNQGDDWKKLLFKDISKSVKIGNMFLFDGSYWVTTSAETLSNITAACVVRRCNNTLRWIDGDGTRHSVPCVLDYSIQENRDYSTGGSKVVNPSGILTVKVQLNPDTNKIVANDRFLFGNSSNWTAYKVFGGGIHNFNNSSTLTNADEGLLTLTMGVSYVNENVDDLVNGYANSDELSYSIVLNKSSISGAAGDTFPLTANVFLNGETASGTIVWSSGDSGVASVTSSGVVTLVSSGSTTITASLSGDSSVSSSCTVAVGVLPISDKYVVVTPETNYILEGESTTFDVRLYESDGIATADTFVFSIVSGGVPASSYDFVVVDGNTFILTNMERYMAESLVIAAVSGSVTRNIQILLKGSW